MGTTGQQSRAELIASKKHTAGLLLIILMCGVAGRLFVTHQPASTLQEFGRTRIYWIALAYEWLVFLYVRLGMRRGLRTVRQIADESSWTIGRLSLYAVIAVGAALAWMACGWVLGLILHPGADEIRHLEILLPRGIMEKALWVVLSASSGFCEEFVYRGYLQQQFHRLTGSLSVAVVLQAVAYGVAHAALPWEVAVSVTCLGMLFGGLAAWRRSLVPGMMMHAGFDILAGLLPRP